MNEHYLHLFPDRMAEGLLVAQSEFARPEETRQWLQLTSDLHSPIVLVDRVLKGTTLDYVGLDQFDGGYMATKHLLDLGHRRIGCVTGPLTLTSIRERLEGYRHALNEAGVDYDPGLVYEGELQLSSGVAALPYLLGRNVSAIFAFNDMIAYGIYKEMRHYNLAVPDDISVVGVDDIVFSDIIQPPLTTVAQPIDAIAAVAVTRLVEIIRDPDSAHRPPQVLKPFLKVRGSTRRVRLP